MTRDSDLEILEKEASDLLARKQGTPAVENLARWCGSSWHTEVPERVRRLRIDKLQTNDGDVYDGSGLLGASAFFAIAQLPRPDPRDPEHTQVTPAQFPTGTDIFSSFARGDLMVHLPYESFTPVLDFFGQASTDPDVLAITMTLYQTGSNPSLVRSLIRVADGGKQVAVLIRNHGAL